MKRKLGKVYDKKGLDVFVDFKGISPEDLPEVSTALIIENDELLKKNVPHIILDVQEILSEGKVRAF